MQRIVGFRCESVTASPCVQSQYIVGWSFQNRNAGPEPYSGARAIQVLKGTPVYSRVFRNEKLPENMSCRTGPLRVGRAFARLFNLHCKRDIRRPSRWSGSSSPTNGKTTENHPCMTGIHATKWPHHAQWARPAGQVVHQKLPRRLFRKRLLNPILQPGEPSLVPGGPKPRKICLRVVLIPVLQITRKRDIFNPSRPMNLHQRLGDSRERASLA